MTRFYRRNLPEVNPIEHYLYYFYSMLALMIQLALIYIYINSGVLPDTTSIGLKLKEMASQATHVVTLNEPNHTLEFIDTESGIIVKKIAVKKSALKKAMSDWAWLDNLSWSNVAKITLVLGGLLVINHLLSGQDFNHVEFAKNIMENQAALTSEHLPILQQNLMAYIDGRFDSLFNRIAALHIFSVELPSDSLSLD